MLHQTKTAKATEKSILKCLLPMLSTNTDWQKWLQALGRSTSVTFEKRQTKEKKPKCIVCQQPFDNFLLLVFHLQLIHKEHIEVTKYELVQDSLVIQTKTKQEINLNAANEFYAEGDSNEYTLLQSLKERSRQILTPIFSKFYKKQVNHKKEYFHSLDIFKEVGPDSQDEDSEGEVGQIEQELQKMRINDFTDVNQHDKLFFMKWNEAVRQAKKQNVYISGETMRNLLKKFAKTAKESGLNRINLLMHAWTLWSAGRIQASDVTNFLQDYDSAVVICPSEGI